MRGYNFTVTMRLVIAGLVALLAACTGLPPMERLTPEQETWLLTGADLPMEGDGVESRIPGLSEAETQLLALTPEMERFAERAVRGAPSPGAKVRALMQALMGAGSLAIRYDETATLTAAEAFAQGRANCLSFTALFVAMARHAGLHASFNEVDVPPIWGMQGPDMMVLYRHINATVDISRGYTRVVDLNLEEYDVSYPQRRISDREAAAQYYNNLAMELLQKDRWRAARTALALAIALDDDLSYLWGNLGILYKRAGNLAAAELALEKAMQVDGGDLVAISNAARLYAETGRNEIAARLEARAQYFRERNPYYRYWRGLTALRHGRYDEARDNALVAIDLYGEEHRFHFLLAVAYRELGEMEKARASFERAINLVSDSGQESKYRFKMQRLLSARF